MHLYTDPERLDIKEEDAWGDTRISPGRRNRRLVSGLGACGDGNMSAEVVGETGGQY